MYVHVSVSIYFFKSDCIINFQYSKHLSCMWLSAWLSVCMKVREFVDCVHGVCEWMQDHNENKWYIVTSNYNLLWNLCKIKMLLLLLSLYLTYVDDFLSSLFSSSIFFFLCPPPKAGYPTFGSVCTCMLKYKNDVYLAIYLCD